MTRKKAKKLAAQPQPRKLKKQEVDDVRQVVQKGIAAGGQVVDLVFDIIKLFS
ncbi:hypothetical protein [Nostoc linckia]|uniref:hypothetical protein n=1 Tax=Nostoc linckia TaxID=92942 RepID=UPI0015D4F4D3|nr:hypothetical protein [Nostoc linckia]